MVRNLAGLKRSARSRSVGAMARATAAIRKMQSEEVEINFRSVATHSTSCHSSAWASVSSLMRAGSENCSASCPARKRLAPATISKALSLGRTTMGWISPPDRMDSASSSSFFWSNVLRGLVLDSKSWSMAMYWNSLLFCMMRSLGCGWWLGL
jgi:hypothetical protein